jgi:SAM-dependent methyltransferase
VFTEISSRLLPRVLYVRETNEAGPGLLGHSYALETGIETLAHYEAWADTYDKEISEELGYAQPVRCAAALSTVVGTQHGAPTGRVLDVGCGTGLSGLALEQAGFTNLDGCDFSAPMLDRAAATGVYRQLFTADLNEGLDVPDETYDAVAAVGVFSFGHIQPSALREMLRVVRLSGAVVIGLNDHYWDLGTFQSEVDAIEADGVATLVFQEHGDHLPGADIQGWVVVLVRAGD